jgi:glycosyltransferase involved in cell wall biosynthesis
VSVRHAWLVSRYPALSHSFIRREVQELRRRGVAIDTFTIRRPPEAELLNPEDRAESAATFAILPAPPLALVATLVRAAATRPRAFVRMLALAFSGSPAGVRAKLWRLFWFVEALLLARELERRAIGRLHVHFADAGAEVGRLAAAFLGIPWSLTLHGFADLSGDSVGALARLVASTRFAACISEFTRTQVARAIPAELAQRLHVVRCGLDVGAIEATPAAPHAPPLRLLSVGRLAPEKGQVGLVDAFADALAAGLDAELVLVGEGGERAKIEEQIARRGVGGRLRLAGAKGEADVDAEYRRCDVFVLSSQMEGIPVVLMEAMARRRPVVAPRVGGIAELVEDGSCGLLFEGGDWKALAAALVEIGRDPATRIRMGEAGRARVAALHSIATTIEPLLERISAPERPLRSSPTGPPVPPPA